MATQPNITQSLGNIPAIRATYYLDNKLPTLALSEGQRVSVQRFKTDKESNTLRQSFVVVVNSVSSAKIRDTDKGAEMIQQMVNDYIDDMLRRCADGKLPFDSCELADKVVADFHDTSRSASGKRITMETIGKWFDDVASAWMVERIVAKFPQFATEKITAVATQYRTALCDLAKYGTPLTKPVTALLSKFHSDFPYAEDDEMKEYFAERIKKLVDKHNADEMLIEAI